MRAWLLCIIFLTVTAAAYSQQGSSVIYDNLDKPENMRQPDSIRQPTAISRLLEKNFGINLNEEAEARIDRENIERYRGFIIRNIYIETFNIADTASKLWFDRTLNALHVVTRENVIRKDLLFEQGDRLDPELMMNNRQLIRSRSYIADVDFDIVPVGGDPAMVDIYVRTRDTWTISMSVRTDSDGEVNMRVFDKNIAGWGTTLGLSTYFNWRHGGYGGNLVDYHIPNVAGTFFSGDIKFGKAFKRNYIGAGVNKEFITDYDYAGGLSYMKSRDTVEIYSLDTTINYGYENFEIWMGNSFRMGARGNNIYFTTRYFTNRFYERPFVDIDYNPFFHNQKMALASVGIYKERFRTATKVYGYGIREDIAYGYRAELVGGYSWGEFADQWYTGGSFRFGRFYRLGYFSYDIGLGTLINPGGKFSRTALVSNIHFISRLMNLSSRFQMRQFTDINITKGWNRIGGFREALAFVDDSELRGLREKAFGQNRLVLRNESVFFTPWEIHGFKFAVFTFTDLGLIGDKANFVQNAFYATVGAGVRVKNEALIFATINIRIGFALNKNGFIDAEYFRISNRDRTVPIRYIPERAQTIDYR